MASAAAVATDISRSPLPEHEVDALGGTVTINSTKGAPDGVNDDGDDDDEDIELKPKRKNAHSNANGVDDDGDVEMAEEEEAMDKDLFGSGSENGEAEEARKLDDSELDSGDDEGRDDRAVAEEEDITQGDEHEELTFMDAALARHPIPNPSDGELYLLKVPRFLSIEPTQFSAATFQPPVTDHHSKGEPSATFSAYNTAMTTIRWRKSPSDPRQLQSNARILRWSDGSLTLQMANNPTTQYRMPGNALAPPQRNPVKPTPTSISDKDKRRGATISHITNYDVSQDSFTYLAAPYQGAQVLRITNKFTTGLKVEPSVDATDEALERLQQSLAAASKSNKSITEGSIGMMQTLEDPELQKKKAELAEKEKIRAQKRREAQEIRERDRAGRALGKRGFGAGGGLTVGGLEDDDELGAGVGGGRRTGMGSKRAKPRRQRRGEILTDEEEDYGRRGTNKEDEYDEEDDFVAPSDEEEEVVDDDEDEDEGIELESSRKKDDTRKARPNSPKRDRNDDEEEVGHTEGSPVARSKRRRVIDEDEDDDE